MCNSSLSKPVDFGIRTFRSSNECITVDGNRSSAANNLRIDT